MQKRGRGSHPSPGVAAREKSDLHQKIFPADLTLKERQLDNIRLVSSFSFVGETDQEREMAAQGYYDELADEMQP